MGGYVMQIQNYSVNDGEGIRTAVFLAGCPLRCRWCANPEGQTMENVMTGYLETDEVIRKIRRQMIFYRCSGGGVTFSGGEATVQLEFLEELTERLYDMGISLALETCGQFEYQKVRRVLEKMDLIFYDIKHMDAERHRFFTGVSNRRILENAERVCAAAVPVVIRVPAIHGVNTDEKNIKETLEFLRDRCRGAKLEFLPYHTLGEVKYSKLGLEPPSQTYQRPSEEEIAGWRRMAEQMGIEMVAYR